MNRHEARSQMLLETRRYQVSTDATRLGLVNSCSCLAKMHWRRWNSEHLPPPPRPCRLPTPTPRSASPERTPPERAAARPQRVPSLRAERVHGSPGQTWPSCDRPETLLAVGLLHCVCSESAKNGDRPETLLSVGLCTPSTLQKCHACQPKR